MSFSEPSLATLEGFVVCGAYHYQLYYVKNYDTEQQETVVYSYMPAGTGPWPQL